MSGFVRRAQRKVAKLEAQLVAARAEVARQKELDVSRAVTKIARDEARKEQKRAERAANPERIRLETKFVLMTICVKKNLKCDPSMVDAYMEWKKAIEFPPKTNLYEKCSRFIQETVSKEVAIPIYAKTLTGELIPLVYRPQHDSRDLLLQLQEISPEEFPLGSTMLSRSCEEEDANTPVKEGDIFGLFRNNVEVVSYRPYSRDKVEFRYDSKRVKIEYGFQIKPEGLVRASELRLKYPLSLSIHYLPEVQTVSTHWYRGQVPISEFEIMLRAETLYDYSTNGSYSLTDQAREEVMAVFHAIRRDRSI